MMVESRETKQKKIVQQLCILETYQVERKVQTSQKETVLFADILVISPSNVVKEVQLFVQSARKGDIYQKHAVVQVKEPTKETSSFASYSQCMNSGTETSSGTGKSNHLIIDTGYTDHIINQKELFENLQPCSIKNFKDPKGNLTPVEGIGDVPVKLHLKNGKEEEMVLRNVLYVPNYEVNLLSVD